MDATVTVTAVEAVGPDTVAIRFETPRGFSAEPGQFVKFTGTVDGEEYSRFYTLSSPDTTATFETTIGIDPDESGPFSKHLSDLEPGDELEFSGPYGSDYYEGESRVVVLAGGPGVGPAVGIGERAIEDNNEAAIIYRDSEPAHSGRLDALSELGATIHVIEDDDELAAHVDDVLTGDEDEQVFVYGFGDFVTEAEAAIETAGGDADEAKVENFG